MIQYSFLSLTGKKIYGGYYSVDRDKVVDTPVSPSTKWLISDLAKKHTPSNETTELFFSHTLEILPSRNFNWKGFVEESKLNGIIV